jgi:hypothetical protein
MAFNTQSDEILLRVIATSAAKLFVMDLQVFRFATELTSPGIPLQNFSTKLLVRLRTHP